jgi:hypothetical protein
VNLGKNKSLFFKTKPTIITCLRIIVSWKLELYWNYFESAWHYHLWTWTIIMYFKLGQFFVNKWKWTKGPSATLALGLWSRLRPTLGSWPKVSLGHGKNETPTQMKIISCLVVKKNILLSTNLLCLVRAQQHTNPTSTLEAQATLRILLIQYWPSKKRWHLSAQIWNKMKLLRMFKGCLSRV